MKRMLNYIIYGSLVTNLFFSNSLLGQNKCFSQLLNQGKVALDAEDFEKAIRSFQSILRNCDQLTEGQRSEAINLTNRAFELNKSAVLVSQKAIFKAEQELSLQKIRASEEAARLREQDYLKSESNRISFLANNENNKANQLGLAYISKRLIDSANVFSQATTAAFGDAVRNNYADIRQSDSGYINDVAITKNGSFVYSINGDIWMKSNEKNSKLINTHEDHILTITAFEEEFITTSKDRTAKIWTSDGTLTITLQGHRDDVNFATVSADGAFILTGSRDSTAILWDANGRILARIIGHEGNVLEGRFSSDGKRVLTRAGDHTIKIWNLAGENLANLVHDSYIHDFFISPGDQSVISSSNDGTIRIWDLDGALKAVIKEHQAPVYQLQLSPNGQYFLSTSADLTAALWQLEGTLVKKFQSEDGNLPPEEESRALAPIRKAFFSPTGNRIITAFRNKIQLITLSGKVLENYQHSAAVTNLVFSPDGQYLLSGAQDNTAKLWDLEGHLLLNLNTFKGHIIGLAFSDSGNHILAYSQDGMLVYCPTPDYIYGLLKQKPPELSEDLRIRYELPLSVDNDH